MSTQIRIPSSSACRKFRGADTWISEGKDMATVSEKPPATVAEPPLEPDLPICAPHHHLRERPNDRYFLDEFIQDSGSGHNIVATITASPRLKSACPTIPAATRVRL